MPPRRLPPALLLLALAGAVTTAATSLGPAAAQEAAAGFRVVNRTGADAVTLNAVRAPRGAQGDWGGNLLRPDRPLTSGGGFRVQPNAEAGCRFDLRLVLADGREAVARDRDICSEREVELAGAAPPAPSRPATIVTPPPAPAVEQQRPNPQARNVSVGTGFLVAPDRVMTNQHVVDGCNRIVLRTPDGRWLGAVPPARVDAQLDLALLAVPGLPGPVLSFRQGPAVRRGDGVVAYGFPLAGLLSSDPKLTRGEVNGLAGIGDNRAQYQISAEVQPGNSGGPLLDMQGNVLGVVVSKLNAQRVAQRTGDIAQNVNFAVKAEAAIPFLQRAGVEPRLTASSGPERSAADVGEIAHRSTLFIRCEK
jgi:S1-C subfamily serine protease